MAENRSLPEQFQSRSVHLPHQCKSGLSPFVIFASPSPSHHRSIVFFFGGFFSLVIVQWSKSNKKEWNCEIKSCKFVPAKLFPSGSVWHSGKEIKCATIQYGGRQEVLKISVLAATNRKSFIHFVLLSPYAVCCSLGLRSIASIIEQRWRMFPRIP
jgi:hypothetical protein